MRQVSSCSFSIIPTPNRMLQWSYITWAYWGRRSPNTRKPFWCRRSAPLSFSQANRNHFDQSGLIGPRKAVCPFDPANHNDGVGLKGEAIHANRIPVRHFPYLHRLHTGEDGAFTELLRDAVALQNIALPLCGGPAMAAHRGDDIGLCPCPFKKRASSWRISGMWAIWRLPAVSTTRMPGRILERSSSRSSFSRRHADTSGMPS